MKVAIGSRIVLLVAIALGSPLLARPLRAQCQIDRTIGPFADTDILSCIEVDGNTLAVSIINNGYPLNQRVDVFRQVTAPFGGWVLEASLPTPHVNDEEKLALALDGDVLAVGATTRSDPLAVERVFVYRRTGNVWNLEQVLESDTPSLILRFGHALALEGDTLVVSEYHQLQERRLHVYLWNGATWTRTAVLSASDASGADFFGSALALRGDTLIVAAEADVWPAVGPGKVYVFQRTGSVWTETQQLFAADPIDYGRFGHDLAFDGTTLAVSARRSAEVDGLCVYTFIEQGGQWAQEARLTIEVPAPPMNWWNALELTGDRMLVGNSENSDAGPAAGTVLVFERNAHVWSEVERLYPDVVSTFSFGQKLAWAGGPAIVYAWFWSSSLYTFVFDDPDCPDAAFDAAPLHGAAPLQVDFTDRSAGLVSEWSWAFGDGSTSDLQHPSYTYTTPGTHTVGLVVRGPVGADRAVRRDLVFVGTSASATVRNGSGANPLRLANLSLPSFGGTWSAEIDTTAHPGASLGALQGRARGLDCQATRTSTS